MNKEITIYELLGLIKNGKEPKKIKVDDVIYFYNYTKKDYKSEIDEPFFLFNDYVDIKSELDKIVKILEEDKDIEEIQIEQYGQNNFYIRNEFGTRCNMTKHSKLIAEKVNELIREVNKLRKDTK